MVPDWKMGIVGLQCILGAPEEYTNVVGVISPGVEIGIIAYLQRQVGLYVFQWK